MAWKATAQKQTGPNGQRLIAIIYGSDSGPASVIDRYEIRQGIDNDFIAQTAAAKLGELTSQDALDAALVEGDLKAAIGAIIPPVLDPGAEQAKADQVAYLAAYQKLKGFSASLELGVIKADDANYLAAQQAVKVLYKPEYAGLVF